MNSYETNQITVEMQIGTTQEKIPFAIVHGTPFTKLPNDLYIPPNALEIFLEAFEGPLDLLLYLIKRQNLNILDIPIAEVTSQYMKYVEIMKTLRLELAAEYLVMAAMLAEIKSRMLLPKSKMEQEDEKDPRAELVRRLQEYERFKIAAKEINALPRIGQDTFKANTILPGIEPKKVYPKINLIEVLYMFHDMLRVKAFYPHHQIYLEPLSVREKMAHLLAELAKEKFTELKVLFKCEEKRQGIIIVLLALLELIKESLVEIIQTTSYGRIYVKRC